jgi:CheY-like chemotaxis protein
MSDADLSMSKGDAAKLPADPPGLSLAELRTIERQGLDFLDSGQFAVAAELLLQAVAGYERHSQPLKTNSAAYHLGVAFAEQGKMDRAVRIWEEIIDRGWDSPAAFSRLLRYYQGRGQKEQVERLFRRLQRAATEQTGEFFAAYRPDRSAKGEDITIAGFEPGTRRVLVADDEMGIITVIERTLKPLGYTILEAANGHDALRIILTMSIDMMILDIFMPGYTGLDVLYRARAEGIRTPALVMSGRADDQMIADVKALGGEWIAKPFDVDDLVSKVKTLVGAGDSPSQRIKR